MNASQPYAIHTLELGPMENFVYVIHDRATGRAAVVDPAWEVPAILELAEREGMRITDILLTHSHRDHTNGVQEILERCDAELHLLKEEADFWGAPPARPTLHRGGDVVVLGKTEIRVLHTPGHTPGSACYHLGSDLIAGDTLFVFGCGRCDLPGGNPEQMYATLKTLTERLPGETVLLPGHNYAIKPTSTLEEQIAGNPFLHFDTVGRFIQYRMHYHDKHRHSPYGPVRKGEETP
ncbi:MAG: MBL fold metallo-hydrolase [Gammaproteobacteria bacterium]